MNNLADALIASIIFVAVLLIVAVAEREWTVHAEWSPGAKRFWRRLWRR